MIMIVDDDDDDIGDDVGDVGFPNLCK